MPKRPALTSNEKKFIDNHCYDPEWTDVKIAKQLGRNSDTIKNYRQKIGVKKTGTGNVIIGDQLISKKLINRSNLTEDEKIKMWTTFFKTTQRYKRLTQQLTAENLEYFGELWAKYCLQFEDMQPSEEEMVEVICTYHLRIGDNQRDFKNAQIHEIDLLAQLGGRAEAELSLEHESDRFLYEAIVSNNRIKMDINKEYRELTGKLESYQRSMNATREQREQYEKIGSDTFLSLVRSMNEYDQRKDSGQYNELMRLATEAKAKDLKKSHKFIDGSQGPIVLDGKDFAKDETDVK
jgi:hypothetical protein